MSDVGLWLRQDRHLGLRWIMATCAAVALVLGIVSSGAARPSWSHATKVAGSLNTAGTANIAAMSCTSIGDCTAGGCYTDHAGQQALIATATAGHWGAGRRVAASLNTGNFARRLHRRRPVRAWPGHGGLRDHRNPWGLGIRARGRRTVQHRRRRGGLCAVVRVRRQLHRRRRVCGRDDAPQRGIRRQRQLGSQKARSRRRG
jgi:hypothetical protein